MKENLQDVVNAAVKLSPGERLELIEAVSRSLQQSYHQLEGLNGEQALEPAIPNYVRRTSPVTSLNSISSQDAWIAATALRYQLSLVTYNPSDYQGISGLTVVTERV